MNSLAGHLLIAAPGMADDFFSSTVVLMLRHSDEGAAGVILNRPSDVQLGVVWSDLPIENTELANRPINIGGPCEGPLIAIHNSLTFAEEPLIPGVAMCVEVENLKKLVRQSHLSIKVFSGYAGWSPNQLESEIERGGWYSIPARPKHIFGDNLELWQQACAQFGDAIIGSVVNPDQIPRDPEVN